MAVFCSAISRVSSTIGRLRHQQACPRQCDRKVVGELWALRVPGRFSCVLGAFCMYKNVVFTGNRSTEKRTPNQKMFTSALGTF